MTVEGPVTWALVFFVGSLASSSMLIAWRARELLAKYELKYDLALAELNNAIQDRNFLGKYDLAIADLQKDVRHTKNNVEQHAVIFGELSDDVIRAQAELQRIGKIVNGKHH